MREGKKILAVLLLAVMTCSCFTGCGVKKSAKTEIYFLSCKPEVADTWAEIAEVYEAETGVRLKVLTASDGNHERTLKAEIAKADAPTMFQINGPVEYEIWKNYCLDVSNTDLYSWMLDPSMAVSADGGVYGIPYVVEGYGIIYNNAIMQKYFSLPGKATSYTSMDQVNNFEALKAVADDMQENASALGIQGVFASTTLAGGEDWRWQTHLMNLPIYYEFKDSGVADKENIDFTYAENYKNIFDLYITDSCTPRSQLLNKTVTDSMEEFATGKCAMVQNGNWAWTQISDVAGNIVGEDDIKYLPIYTGVAGEENQGICIGTENYICINSRVSEEKQQATIDFLEWLYSSETGKDYVTNRLGFIPPFNTFEESEYPSNPLAKEVIKYMSSADKYSVSWNFVAFPSQSFKDTLGASLADYSQENKEWNSIVAETKSNWASEKAK